MDADVVELDQARADRCRCEGDGRTWVDVGACPVHDLETSPLAKALDETWERMAAEARSRYRVRGLGRDQVGP